MIICYVGSLSLAPVCEEVELIVDLWSIKITFFKHSDISKI